MKEAFLAADKKEGRIYRELQKSMVSHSQFVFFTNSTNEREKLNLIENFYNDIRNTRFAKHNTFFWEQFASAYIDMKKFDLVKKCIDNALIEANKNPKFVPFQVKTVLGRYYVEKCYDDLLKKQCNKSEAITAITSATDAILIHYSHPENNLYYVFKVVRKFSEIYLLIDESLDSRELSIYIEKTTIMKKHMEEYLADSMSPYYENVQKWYKEIEKTLDDAKSRIKNIS